MSTTSNLFEQVYDRLRALAERRFQQQPSGATLQPTALVHEVYMRLVRQDRDSFADREHFMAVAATAMRQILVDQARRRNATKRGGDLARVTLDQIPAMGDDAPLDVLDLDRVITGLAELHPRQAQVVELRVFAGMTVPEVASVLDVSVATVEKDWRQARAWMRLELERGR